MDYIKTYMSDYVAGNQLSADFYAYVFRRDGDMHSAY